MKKRRPIAGKGHIMRPYILKAGLLLSGLLLACGPGMDTVEYNGAVIHLSKSYYDYELYKLDPHSVADYELPRLERLMLEFPVAGEYPGYSALVQGISGFDFPGRGSSHSASRLPTGESLHLFCVEIPQRDRERCVLYAEQQDKKLVKRDDFVASTLSTPILTIRVDPKGLAYLDEDGRALAVKPTALALRDLS